MTPAHPAVSANSPSTPALGLAAIPPEEMAFPVIDVWTNHNTHRQYVISIDVPEFTSVCPMTGLPDYGTLIIDYVPDQGCIELKAFKYYILAYRNVGIFYENAVNRILDDLVTAANPQYMRIQGKFTPRGGISTRIAVVYQRPGFVMGTVDQLLQPLV
jgi:7-cyano-7-deazaguanine reductase